MSKPNIISVGPEACPPGERELLPGTVWCVDHYTPGSYEGSGFAYCFANGQLYEKSLSHCSCYGPWTPGESGDWNPITKDELLTMHLAGDDAATVVTRNAVLQLL